MENNSGIKYLVQINSLAKLFNDVIKINDYNSAYNFIYKMRIIHGSLIVESNKNNDISDENLFNISCIHSVLNVINEKIIESETLFNKLIIDNNIDISKLKINKSETLDDLPLFNGSKSIETTICEEIKTISSESFKENIPSLILFYNPHCPACVKTKPFWTEITTNIKEKFSKDTTLFNIIEINLAEPQNEKLARLFKIEYIPTIIMMESSNRPRAMIEQITGFSDSQKINKFIKESFDKFLNK
jgi:thiol-disulfide isomerase/thioredoxin